MKHKADPFVKRSTLRYLTRGETPSVRAVALQLHFGMVTALREGDGTIHATWKEVADWAGVSYASVKRAALRLRELGWVKELPGHRLVFDYRRSCPVKKAQFEPSHSIELETLREGCTHPDDEASNQVSDLPPSGEDVRGIPVVPPGKSACSEFDPDQAAHNRLVQADPQVRSLMSYPRRKPRLTDAQRESLAILIAIPGVDRAGAMKAVKSGGPDLVGRVRKIVEAVQALPTKPWKPGGLIVAAVMRPELGQKLIRDHAQGGHKNPASVHQQRRKDVGATPAPELRNNWEVMRKTVRGWLDLVDLGCPEDREWVIQMAAGRGWSCDTLRSLPELCRALG